jgi:hypothetical protein
MVPGLAALAIDPNYAPVLLTVACFEHGGGRHANNGASRRLMAEQ